MARHIQHREIKYPMGGFFSVWLSMLSAYAPRRGSRLSGRTREGISQRQQVKNLEGQGCAAEVSGYGKEKGFCQDRR